MSKAPKMKPARVAGKRKIQAPTTSPSSQGVSAKNAILSPFEHDLQRLRQRYLGPPKGEPGNDGALQRETLKCELSTKRGILVAKDTAKLEAFYAGFSELQDRLCEVAAACYRDCIKFVENNRSKREAPPADFASSFTHECISTFLKVIALDSAGEDRETASNRRVGWFVRHVCGDWSDEFPPSSVRTGESFAFHLPQWFSIRWNARAQLAERYGRKTGYTVTSATDPLSMEETEDFIVNKEQTVIKEVRNTIADAHCDGVVEMSRGEIAVQGASKSKFASQEVWPGTARQLGDEVIEQYKNGKIGAKSDIDALRKACLFFVKQDGTPFKAENILQNLKNRKDNEQKGPSVRPTALSTLVKRFANVTSRRPHP